MTVKTCFTEIDKTFVYGDKLTIHGTKSVEW